MNTSQTSLDILAQAIERKYDRKVSEAFMEYAKQDKDILQKLDIDVNRAVSFCLKVLAISRGENGN
jgi:hypothetical protein